MTFSYGNLLTDKLNLSSGRLQAHRWDTITRFCFFFFVRIPCSAFEGCRRIIRKINYREIKSPSYTEKIYLSFCVRKESVFLFSFSLFA